MPDILEYADFPEVMLEYHIEPFREEYIPGSRVVCRVGSKGEEVFFQIPKPIALKITESKLEELKKQIDIWWKNRGTSV